VTIMPSRRVFLACLSVAGGCAVLALLAWKFTGGWGGGATSSIRPSARPEVSVKPAAGDLDPVLAVLAHGGTALELGRAIGMLDTLARLRTGLPAAQCCAPN